MITDKHKSNGRHYHLLAEISLSLFPCHVFLVDHEVDLCKRLTIQNYCFWSHIGSDAIIINEGDIIVFITNAFCTTVYISWGSHDEKQMFNDVGTRLLQLAIKEKSFPKFWVVQMRIKSLKLETATLERILSIDSQLARWKLCHFKFCQVSQKLRMSKSFYSLLELLVI